MRPTENDPFDLGFDAADEFTTGASDPWRSSAPSLTPAGGFEDPFADFPPARPRDEAPPPARSPQAAPLTTRPTPQTPAAAPVVSRAVVSDDDDRDTDPPVVASVGPAPAYDEPITESGFCDAVIPRITIHAFCARPETAALI